MAAPVGGNRTNFILLLLVPLLQNMLLLQLTEFGNLNVYRVWLVIDIHIYRNVTVKWGLASTIL